MQLCVRHRRRAVHRPSGLFHHRSVQGRHGRNHWRVHRVGGVWSVRLPCLRQHPHSCLRHSSSTRRLWGTEMWVRLLVGRRRQGQVGDDIQSVCCLLASLRRHVTTSVSSHVSLVVRCSADSLLGVLWAETIIINFEIIDTSLCLCILIV